MKKTDAVLKWLVPALSVGTIFLLWVIAASAAGSEYVFPSVSQTFRKLFELFSSPSFYRALSRTLLRTLIAFSASFFGAAILAFLSEKSVNFSRFITPFIRVLRALPTIAVVLLLLFFTSPDVAAVLVTTLVVFPTTYSGLKEAAASVDRGALEMCEIYGVEKRRAIWRVAVPELLPAVFRTAGAGFSLNLKLMVAAEVLAQVPASIGYLLQFNKTYFETATMLALVVVSVALGLLIEGAFSLAARRSEKWR